jgi:hypothetical protein
MRAHSFYGLLLLFAVALAEACGAGDASQNRESPSAVDSSGAGVRAAGNRGTAGAKDYVDPNNDFAVKIPAGWKVKRDEEDGAYMTVITPEPPRAAHISIMTIQAAPAKTAPPDLRARMLVESSAPYFKAWMDGLREQARVEVTRDIHRTRFDKFDALRMDVTYHKGDADDPRRARTIFLLGNKTTFFISVTGSQSLFNEPEEIISTIRIEP